MRNVRIGRRLFSRLVIHHRLARALGASSRPIRGSRFQRRRVTGAHHPATRPPTRTCSRPCHTAVARTRRHRRHFALRPEVRRSTATSGTAPTRERSEGRQRRRDQASMPSTRGTDQPQASRARASIKHHHQRRMYYARPTAAFHRARCCSRSTTGIFGANRWSTFHASRTSSRSFTPAMHRPDRNRRDPGPDSTPGALRRRGARRDAASPARPSRPARRPGTA